MLSEDAYRVLKAYAAAAGPVNSGEVLERLVLQPRRPWQFFWASRKTLQQRRSALTITMMNLLTEGMLRGVPGEASMIAITDAGRHALTMSGRD